MIKSLKKTYNDTLSFTEPTESQLNTIIIHKIKWFNNNICPSVSLIIQFNKASTISPKTDPTSDKMCHIIVTKCDKCYTDLIYPYGGSLSNSSKWTMWLSCKTRYLLSSILRSPHPAYKNVGGPKLNLHIISGKMRRSYTTYVVHETCGTDNRFRVWTYELRSSAPARESELCVQNADHAVSSHRSMWIFSQPKSHFQYFWGIILGWWKWRSFTSGRPTRISDYDKLGSKYKNNHLK